MKQVQRFYTKQLVFGKEIPVYKEEPFLPSDRIIFFTRIKYSFHNLNVCRMYESEKNNNIPFL